MANKSPQWIHNNRRMHAIAGQLEGTGLSAHEAIRASIPKEWCVDSVKDLKINQQLNIIRALGSTLENQNRLLKEATPGKIVELQISAITALRYKIGWSRQRLLADVATCYGVDELEDMEYLNAVKYIQRLKRINANKKTS